MATKKIDSKIPDSFSEARADLVLEQLQAGRALGRRLRRGRRIDSGGPEMAAVGAAVGSAARPGQVRSPGGRPAAARSQGTPRRPERRRPGDAAGPPARRRVVEGCRGSHRGRHEGGYELAQKGSQSGERRLSWRPSSRNPMPSVPPRSHGSGPSAASSTRTTPRESWQACATV